MYRLRARYPDELPAVAVSDLYRSREPLGEFEFDWPMDVDSAVCINAHPLDDHVRLGCSFVSGGRSRERKTALVPIVFQEGPRGGARAYFVCPACGARRTQLFVHPYELEPICRVCAGISYESQRHSSEKRKLVRAQRIRVELGGAAENFGPLPDRPFGMHWSTYERRIEKISELEEAGRLLRVQRILRREQRRLGYMPSELALDAGYESGDMLRAFLDVEDGTQPTEELDAGDEPSDLLRIFREELDKRHSTRSRT